MAFDGRLLAGLGVLAAVVEGGSFIRAADALGLSPSGVSRAIARLEARLNVRLVERTTRSLRLTDEGRRFFEQVSPLLSGIEEAAAQASASRQAVRGRLRVNVDPLFSRLSLAPRLPDLLALYPELVVELFSHDEMGDLVAEGVDVAVRFGPPPASNFVARLLRQTPILTVAAPSYLERNGRPETPQDLARHTCIQFRDPMTHRPFEWEFHRDDEVLAVATHGPLMVTDVGTMLAACIAGAGVAQVMELSARELLRDGHLVEIFPDWRGELFPLYAIYPSRRHPPAKVRAFIDFCLEVSG